MPSNTEYRLSQALTATGVLVAALATYALFGTPVVSSTIAVVRSLAILGGLSVAAGGAGILTGRLPVLPVAPIAAVPGSLAGAAVAISLEQTAAWVQVAAGVAQALGILGFALVAFDATSDTP